MMLKIQVFRKSQIRKNTGNNYFLKQLSSLYRHTEPQNTTITLPWLLTINN